MLSIINPLSKLPPLPKPKILGHTDLVIQKAASLVKEKSKEHNKYR